MVSYNVVIVGYGEIARLAHFPVLSSRCDTHVVGVVDVNFPKEEVKKISRTNSTESSSALDPLKFASINDAFDYFGGNIHALCICTPKTVTLSVALECLETAALRPQRKLLGILIEKPPGDDCDELNKVVDYARSNGVSIFTACHTAACPSRRYIDEWLFEDNSNNSNINSYTPQISMRRLKSIIITWKESVRKWHPGQVWISTASGGGVTDMLFNPLSLIVSLFGLESKSIQLTKAELIRPCNWEAPISGFAELIITIPYRDSDDSTEVEMIDIPLTAEFAFDYEPPANDDKKEDEIWSIDFVDFDCSILKLTDGGAQAFLDLKRVTTEPTAEYPLRPEYEKLYDQFVDLLQRNQGDAPSIVDGTTLSILKEIVKEANYRVGPRFDF